jgi:hypothetical protein
VAALKARQTEFESKKQTTDAEVLPFADGEGAAPRDQRRKV